MTGNEHRFSCSFFVSGSSAVLCMSPTHSGGFVSGGADGMVRVWDETITAKGASINIGQASLWYSRKHPRMDSNDGFSFERSLFCNRHWR